MEQRIRYFIDTMCRNYVDGWALGPSGLCRVEVMVDGRMVGRAVTGLQRSDVGAALPEHACSSESGFLYAFCGGDLPRSRRDLSVWLRIESDGQTLETERFTIPSLEGDAVEGPLPPSCLPPAVTELLLRSAPSLSLEDLTSEAGAFLAVEALEHLVQRGPRPLPAVHRYLGYLRSVAEAAIFASRYFPKVNSRAVGERDGAGMLTSQAELVAIAHHLFVLDDSGVGGVVLEFGCYKGYSTAVLSTACHLLGRKLHVFDSFEGLPSTSSVHYRPGEFAGDMEEVRDNITAFGRPDVVTFHPGFFDASVPKWHPEPVMCLWMDVDLERSALDALRVLPSLDPRGALFSHECKPRHFRGRLPLPERAPEEVVGPIVDAFTNAARRAVGLFLCGHTGAFWDADVGIAVLPPKPFERLVELARR